MVNGVKGSTDLTAEELRTDQQLMLNAVILLVGEIICRHVIYNYFMPMIHRYNENTSLSTITEYLIDINTECLLTSLNLIQI